MNIPYPFHEDIWAVDGPKRVLIAATELLELKQAFTVIDIGCGPGVWLECCKQLGAETVLGVDGSIIPADLEHLMAHERIQADLTQPLVLSKARDSFDLAICTEVAEHLPAAAADVLVESITCCSPSVIFSAAGPDQAGSGHINCQWPEYWQAKFNSLGFRCDDALRWIVWDDSQVEPWYRQNLMTAQQASTAGSEPRIKRVIHPETQAFMIPGKHAQAVSRGLLGRIREAVMRRGASRS